MPSPHDEPVQELAWPEGTCYGCGPANADGLDLESHLSEDEERLEATFEPDADHNAGDPNILYGGLIASLIDCHSMWTAITFAHLDAHQSLTDEVAYFVTSELEVDYRKSTRREIRASDPPRTRSCHRKSTLTGTKPRSRFPNTNLGLLALPVPDDVALADPRGVERHLRGSDRRRLLGTLTVPISNIGSLRTISIVNCPTPLHSP